MAGPKEEWMIWGEECQRHIKSLNQRVDKLFHPTERLEPLSEKVNNILNICSHLQEDNNALQDRVLHLEQEINEQDSINNVKSQEQEQLKAKFKTQQLEFGNVMRTVATMQRTNRVEREQYKREMKELRNLVEGIVSGGHGDAVQARPRATSNATTADESMQLDREPDAQPAHTPPIYSVDFSAQGAASLADYLRYADDIMQPVEAHAIQSFVKGMHINHQREVVKGQLKASAWTWHNLKFVIIGMVADNKKRKEKRRGLDPPF